MMRPMLRLPSLTRFLPCMLLISACEPFPIEQGSSPRPVPQRNAMGQPTGIPAGPQWIADVPDAPPPGIYAESALVVDINRGSVLYAKNADSRRAVASTQKIITALCVVDAGDLDKQVRIAATDGNCEPSKLGLRAGEAYTRRELLQVLLIKSSNDVARALARDVAGSQAAFADLMNRKCAELGMRNSHFRNPHGLTEPGQYSTARDMAIAAIAAYQQPVIRSFTDTEQFTFRFHNGRTLPMTNTNKVLKELPYCNGMKTGTTRASGRCLIATGSLHGRDIAVIVLKSNSRHIWSDSSKLLRWALER